MKSGFTPYSDTVVLVPVRHNPSSRAHSHDTMEPLMMMKSSFQLLLTTKESQNYSANIQVLSYVFCVITFSKEKFLSGTEVKQNRIQ